MSILNCRWGDDLENLIVISEFFVTKMTFKNKGD